MSIQTGIPYRVLADEDWKMLRTYEEVIAELNGKERPVDGTQALINQSQKFGG